MVENYKNKMNRSNSRSKSKKMKGSGDIPIKYKVSDMPCKKITDPIKCHTNVYDSPKGERYCIFSRHRQHRNDKKSPRGTCRISRVPYGDEQKWEKSKQRLRQHKDLNAVFMKRALNLNVGDGKKTKDVFKDLAQKVKNNDIGSIDSDLVEEFEMEIKKPSATKVSSPKKVLDKKTAQKSKSAKKK